jgi:ADP-ribose pyrophosphatase
VFAPDLRLSGVTKSGPDLPLRLEFGLDILFEMKKLIEKVLSSEIVFPGRFLKIWRDEVELPSGHLSFREYIKHPGAAMVIPRLPNGKYLMIHQYRHAVGQVFLEFPAGKTDRGESTEQTAARELQEEVGFKPGKLIFLTSIHPVIGYSNEKIDIYLAENLIAAPPHQDPDEVLELVEFSEDEIFAKVWAQEITDVKTQIGVFWLLRHLGRI